MAEVLSRVRRWDPVGLEGIDAPDDEYDCLVGPISSALSRGTYAPELATTIDGLVADHFGVEAAGSLAFAEDLVRWHARQRPTSDIQQR